MAHRTDTAYDTAHRGKADTDNDAAYRTEHMAAWAMSALALVLGALGMLRGFGMLGAGEDYGTVTAGSPTTEGVGYWAIWDSAVWLLPAIAAALLAMALHRNDHHRMRSTERLADDEEGLWKTEHTLAWVLTGATIAFGALGILTGFDVFDRGNDQPDALPWLLASLTTSILANALHAVRHHQLAADEDYILQVVERRAGMHATDRTTGVVYEPGTEVNRPSR